MSTVSANHKPVAGNTSKRPVGLFETESLSTLVTIVADFGDKKTATVAENCDCRRIRQLSPFCRRFRRQSPFSRQSHFSATVWTGLYRFVNVERLWSQRSEKTLSTDIFQRHSWFNYFSCAEMYMGPHFLTQPDPTQYPTDPTQPGPTEGSSSAAYFKMLISCSLLYAR